MSALNLQSRAWNTAEWLEGLFSIAIPVYQRDYRWDLADCDQLLQDVRRAADADEGRSHFIGSILATRDGEDSVTLVDGQQRVTTLMLLIAALRDLARESGSALAAHADSMLLRDGQPKLVPHPRAQDVVAKIIGGAGTLSDPSPFVVNYEFFRQAIVDDWEAVWGGVLRLEHVAIELKEHADAQQIFESLNSTGAALSDDELIHNYVLMGRGHEDQVQFEEATWAPIESATAPSTRDFWRDYLVLTSDVQPEFVGDFPVYKAFRRRYPDAKNGITPAVREDWKQHASWYSVLLRPESESDEDVHEALGLLKAFEGAPRPLLLWLYGQYATQQLNRSSLLDILDQVQTLFIRRALVGLTRDVSLIGTICREARSGQDLSFALVRRTPEDPQVRLALTHSALPHAGYVLQRIQTPSVGLGELQVEHIHPQNPNPGWTGGDGKTWGGLSTDEQAEYRTVLNTIGNLTLLEAPLNQGAGNRSFKDKAVFYSRSGIEETRAFASRVLWDRASIEERTRALIERFLEIWPRASDAPLDEPEGLVRVVDIEPVAVRGYPDVFDYCVFAGQMWGDVHNAKQLLVRIADELWRRDSKRLLATEFGHFVEETRQPRRQYARLSNGGYLYVGWANRYLLAVARSYVMAFGLEDRVRVKLSAVEQDCVGAARY